MTKQGERLREDASKVLLKYFCLPFPPPELGNWGIRDDRLPHATTTAAKPLHRCVEKPCIESMQGDQDAVKFYFNGVCCFETTLHTTNTVEYIWLLGGREGGG